MESKTNIDMVGSVIAPAAHCLVVGLFTDDWVASSISAIRWERHLDWDDGSKKMWTRNMKEQRTRIDQNNDYSW